MNEAIKNCISCGRDTTAKSGICYRCVGRGVNSDQINDTKGREIIPDEMTEKPEINGLDIRYGFQIRKKP